MRISFGGRGGNLPPATFTVGASGATHVRVSKADGKLPGTTLLAGILPYFMYDVLYDGVHPAVGLKPRASP